MQETITDLVERVRALNSASDSALLMRAYEKAEEAHKGQVRVSGEPYIVHPLAVAYRLLPLKPDDESVCAALLHDVAEDTEVTIENIAKEFGAGVARLCEGLIKFKKVQVTGQEAQAENLRKMFVAMAEDLRVIFIKLADRLHNMETLSALRPDKQQRIARETMDIYAPIAARLGLYFYKTHLEDLAFRYLYPEGFARLTREVAGTASMRQKIIDAASDRLKNLLKEEGIVSEVTGRVKHYYSIYQKIQKKKFAAPDELYDLFALRVIVPSPADCYVALGILHNHFRPLSNRFKDFIAVPKSNGYQSLHTTVLGLDTSSRGYPIEVQIRTQAMHETAEKGAAAHFRYAEKKESVVAEEQKITWVRNLVELHDRLKDNAEFVETLSTDALKSRIFVLTPKGAVLDLPKGATPIDFAYHIHTDVGHTCVGAKVGGVIVPLNSTLKNGDVVEIVRRRGAVPNRFWLSFVRTDGARVKIRAYFNALTKADNIAAGREMLNKQLLRYGHDKLDAELTLLKEYKKEGEHLKDRENILERVGNGNVSVTQVIKEVLHLDTPEKKEKPAYVPENAVYTNKQVCIAGEAGIAYTLAKCCNPTERDEIVALVSPRKGAVIHAATCKQLAKSNPERKLPAGWGVCAVPSKLVWVSVEAKNRVGLLRDIAGSIADSGVSIGEIRMLASDSTQVSEHFQLEITSIEQLLKVMDGLERVEGVTRVVRV